MALTKREIVTQSEGPERSTNIHPLWNRKKIYVLNWETLGKCLEKIRDQIIINSFHPMTIAGISRGGLIPATYFANVFNIEDFEVLGIARNVSNDKYSRKQEPELLWMSSSRSLRDRTILLVDDVAGEGRTMSAALNLLEKRGATYIQSAVIARMQNSQFKPDYYAVSLDDWIIFPWEKVDPCEGKDFEMIKI